MTEAFEVAIRSDGDIVVARQRGRALAGQLGFSPGELALIATSISELARNILQYAGMGEITVKPIADGAARHGIVIIAADKGPGIPDVRRALEDGYSTSGGFGLGLPGVKRLMDEFKVASEMGQGTTVTVKKWRC